MNAEQLRVLRFLADHFDQLDPSYPVAGPRGVGLAVPGVEPERVLVALRDLYGDGLITGVKVHEVDYPVRVTGLTPGGSRAARSG